MLVLVVIVGHFEKKVGKNRSDLPGSYRCVSENALNFKMRGTADSYVAVLPSLNVANGVEPSLI